MTNNESNLAIVEFKSIAMGIYVTDYMLKEASVSIVLATTLCPGKYLTIVEGDVSAVEKALNVANQTGMKEVYSSQAVNAIKKEVTLALSGLVRQTLSDSMAIIESQNMAKLIGAADISIETSDVEIVELRLGKGCGVNSFCIITGNLTAVEEAVKSSVSFLKDEGAMIAYRILKNPDRDILRWLEPGKCMC
jgi:microcompartment protein CcmL/EutN